MSAVPITPAGKKKLIVKTTVFSYTLLIRHLTLHDSTVTQLLEITGLHRQTVGNILRAFHKLDVIHIIGWLPDRTGRSTTPIYRWGTGIDAKRRAQTPAERQQKQRNKRKAQRESTRKQDLLAIETGLKNKLITTASSGYSVFSQTNLLLQEENPQ